MKRKIRRMRYSLPKPLWRKALDELKTNWISIIMCGILCMFLLTTCVGCATTSWGSGITKGEPSRVSTIPYSNISRAMDATALVYVASGSGSAFCLHPSGLFITARHVVSDVPLGMYVVIRSEVGTKAERIRKAQVVWVSGVDDVALLRVIPERGDKPYTALKLANAYGLKVGNEVAAVGFPLGDSIAHGLNLRPSVSPGSVTAIRKDSRGRIVRIQSDVAIAPGNSGGPVIDRYGNVVGIAVSGYLNLQINFILPINVIKDFVGNPVKPMPVDPDSQTE